MDELNELTFLLGMLGINFMLTIYEDGEVRLHAQGLSRTGVVEALRMVAEDIETEKATVRAVRL